MDEDQQRREHILNIILIGSIVMLAILDAIVLFYSLRDGSADREISFGAFSLLPAFFVLLYAISRRGFSKIASYLLIGAYFASNSYAAWRWGVNMQVVLIVYALIIIAATILRGTKFGFFVTGLIAAFVIPIGYAQYNGVIATQVQKTRMADLVIFCILYLMIMIVAWLYDREVERSLRRARRSEHALKEERDLLEVKVIERTDELLHTQMEKVQQLNRLAELGQLSSGLFHDLLNLLNALSLRDYDDHADPALAQAARNTTQQIDLFMQALKKQISGASAREYFSLPQGIDHVIQLVNYQANKKHVRIIFDYDRRTDIIQFDAPFKFQEIAINLLMNAIESYENSSGAERIVTIRLNKKDKNAVLSIADNGCGMTPEVCVKIFEPFFTTKERSEGIGIGLATIKKIIEEDMSGTIVAQSTPGVGTLFVVTFPIQDAEGTRTISDTDRPRHRAHQEPTIS